MARVAEERSSCAFWTQGRREKSAEVTGAYRVLQNVHMGWVSFPLVCFILLPFLCSSPALVLRTLKTLVQLSVGNWALL